MKSFNTFFSELNGGLNNSQLTGHLDELLKAVRLHGQSGSLTIKLKVKPTNSQGSESVLIGCESQLTLPKPVLPSDMFYLTDDAEPTRKHPRQHELALQGVRSVGETATDAAVRTFTTPDADGVITPRQVGGNSA